MTAPGTLRGLSPLAAASRAMPELRSFVFWLQAFCLPRSATGQKLEDHATPPKSHPHLRSRCLCLDHDRLLFHGSIQLRHISRLAARIGDYQVGKPAPGLPALSKTRHRAARRHKDTLGGQQMPLMWEAGPGPVVC